MTWNFLKGCLTWLLLTGGTLVDWYVPDTIPDPTNTNVMDQCGESYVCVNQSNRGKEEEKLSVAMLLE